MNHSPPANLGVAKPGASRATLPDAGTKPPHVVILMAVWNGADNLPEQLESLSTQSHQNWQLLVSDDGSTDASCQKISEFAAQGHRITCLTGPELGAGENFMSLIRAMPDHAAENSWLAFCDQDDVWHPDRLARGIAALEVRDKACPALYCSRSWITRADLSGRRISALRSRPPGFHNALVQNIVSGNTILLNPAATRLVQAAARESGPVVVHDWWVYLIITGAGGRVVHDDQPTLLYRQHTANQVGANDSGMAKMKRLVMLLRGDFRDWNTRNIAALRRSSARLTPENRALLEEFSQMRESHFHLRLWRLYRMGLYRQSYSSTLALWLAALLRRL